MVEFTKTVAKKILRMLEGERIPLSSFSNRMYSELDEEGLVGVITRGSRNSIYFLNIDAARLYIENKYTGGKSISRWLELLDGCTERSVLVKELGCSKAVGVRTFRGFLVNCCEPVDAVLGERKFTLSPIEDTAVFIQNPDIFRVEDDVVIVGVENGENFHYIRRLRYLFDYDKVLFVSRYPQSSELRNWLMSVKNPYVHFGDFDLAGINIYLTEFYKYLGSRSVFFVPSDIDERLRKGNEKLYDIQYSAFHDMKISDERVRALVDLINKYHKVYEQEGYIE